MHFRPAIGPHVPTREWENLSWTALDGVEADSRHDTVIREAAQIGSVVRRLLDAGRVALAGSPLVTPTAELSAILPADVDCLRRMRLAAVPLTSQNSALHGHLEVAGLLAKHLATAVKAKGIDVPVQALQAAGELNDIGKLSGVFRYHLNDVLGDAILDDLHIHSGVRALFMPIAFNVGPVHRSHAASMTPEERAEWVRQYCDEIFDALTLEQKLFIYADSCGKPIGPSFEHIQTFEGMRKVHMSSRASGSAYQQYIGAKTPVWPSEIYGIDHIEGYAAGWMTIYERIQAEFESMGISLDDVHAMATVEWHDTNGPARHRVT